MAGLGKITVHTSELITASENVTNLADSYNADYTKLYSLIDELRSSWDGKDNQAYTLQIAEFKNDFEAMEALMRQYAEFLSMAATKYRETQDNITSQAKTLATGR